MLTIIQKSGLYPSSRSSSRILNPMGHSQVDKAESHDKIVRIAARKLREDGPDALSVNELMRAAGLTHGGFYKHFNSREALILEAFEAALADSGKNSRAAARQMTGAPTLASYVRAYLSRSHRDGVGAGCAMAALAGDMPRASKKQRSLFTRAIRGMAERMAAFVAPESTTARRQGLFAASAMIGALVLARAVDDETLSDEILMAARQGVLGLTQQ
jgi:TetR/AcrR family transcriptional repressor of nem operon